VLRGVGPKETTEKKVWASASTFLSTCLSCCCSTDEKELLQVMCVDKNLNMVAGRGDREGVG
jgi:hypothetical protein